MNALVRLDGLELWHLAGWTMLHFLWLGTLAGLAAGACRLLLRQASANVRYAAALVCLATIAALPVAIAAWMGSQLPSTQVTANSLVALPAEIAPPAPGSAGGSTGLASPSIRTTTVPAIEPEPLAIANTGSNPRQSRGLADVIAGVAVYLPWLWLVGTPFTFLLLTTGVVGAERLRRASRPITEGPLAEAAARIAASLRITRRVTIAVCERIAAPVLVGIVRPMILLPPAALTGWSPDEVEMVLLHELAHVRRWDNLVNLAQRILESLLFFHPAVWLVSTWVRREREACCDAVVVERTNRPHAYAELLVEFAALVSEPSEPGRPRPRLGAFTRGRGRPGSQGSLVSAMAAGPLRGRIRRILGIEDDPLLISGKSLGVVMSGLLLAATLVVLNLTTSTQAEEERLTTEGTEDTESAKAEVAFVGGVSRFKDGDGITITRVRGTSTTFEPGSTYWIEGTYKLASRERATLGANVTALSAAEGRSSGEKNHSTEVESGSGKFSLRLPMKYRGKPHVSFYPAEGGQSFGGVYFGTGDSVLTKWWGEKEFTTEGTETQEENEVATTPKSDDNEIVVSTHFIPRRLFREVRGWAKLTGQSHQLDMDSGRLVLQAPRSIHRQLDGLLVASEGWHERANRKAPLELFEEDGGPQLAWRDAGLTLGISQAFQGGVPFKDRQGVSVVAVMPASPASWNQVKPGDILFQVEGFKTPTVHELRAILDSINQRQPTTQQFELFVHRPDGHSGRGSRRVQLHLLTPTETDGQSDTLISDRIRLDTAEGRMTITPSKGKVAVGVVAKGTEGTEKEARPTDGQTKTAFFDRSKFVPSDDNKLETRHYEVADPSRTELDLDAISAVLSADTSEPRTVFLNVWSHEYTRLKVVAPQRAQEFIESILRETNISKWQAATQNNLKKLMLAVLNYEAATHYFPTRAQFDANGKPLLSWRVLVLPYMGEEEAKLYAEFRLNEPWDSEHNRKLVARMPKVFKNPRIDKPGMTNYLAVVGDECMFRFEDKPVQMKHVTDGTAHTIALVEADAERAVEWTKPEDWEFDRERPTAGLGNLWPDGWYAAWVDGHIRMVSNNESPDMIGIQFTRGGGETERLDESVGMAAGLTTEGTEGTEEKTTIDEQQDDVRLVGKKPSEKDLKHEDAEQDTTRIKFVARPDNPLETRSYDISNAPNTNLRLEWMVEMLKRDSSDPKPYFGYNWTYDWTRLEVIAPKEGQEFIKPMILKAQSPTASLPDEGSSLSITPANRSDKFPTLAEQKLADDWPAGVVFPSPEEGEISKRAWQTLGIKLVPATPEESRAVSRQRREVKILGGVAIPSGFESLILESIHGEATESFEGVDRVLDSLEGLGDPILIKCLTKANGVPTDLAFFVTPGNAFEAKRPGQATRTFPTLAEQKLADVVYRRLGLELEPLSADDLNRVQALGYEGGMKVSLNDGTVISWERFRGGIVPNDILVGLHVWPTKSAADVVQVLQRDDLAELNPLKFYLIRQVEDTDGMMGEMGGGRGMEGMQPRDEVVTGRISVKVPAKTQAATSDRYPTPVPSRGAEISADALVPAAPDTELETRLASDLNLALLNQQLMKLQYELGKLNMDSKNAASRERVGIEREIAEAQRKISEYRENVRLQMKSSRQPDSEKLAIPRIPNAVVAKSGAPIVPAPVSDAAGGPPRPVATPNETTPPLRENGPPIELPSLDVEDVTTASPASPSRPVPELELLFLYEPDTAQTEKAMAVTREYIGEYSNRLEINSVNVRAVPKLAADYGAETFPTYLLLKNGNVVARHVGTLPEQSLREMLASANDSSQLRYDGKTFDQWRSAWKTELSTEKRMEAVKALSAFGANGYGKEAAEAIIEVAGQYDFTSIGVGLDGDIKNVCIAALGGPTLGPSIAHRVPAKDALPALLKAAESPNVNSRLFALWVLTEYMGESQQAVEALAKLTDDSDATVRSLAYEVGTPIAPQQDEPAWSGIPPHVGQDLLSSDSQTVREAIRFLIKDADWFRNHGMPVEQDGPFLYYTGGFFPLLFSRDESVRKEARQAFRFLKDSDRTVVRQLEGILTTAARRKDHLEAIRALAALGPKASPAMDRLKQLLASDDPQIRIAAAAAIKMIVGKGQYQKPVADVLGEELGITVVESNGVWGAVPREGTKVAFKAFVDFNEAVIKEQEQLFPDGKF